MPSLSGNEDELEGGRYPVMRATANINDIKTTITPVVKTSRSANKRRI
jgi:DNA gyrase inhibitor GyrI